MIDRERYRMVGGLDESRFFLGFDDHDLAYRAYRDHKLRCGFLPVKFDAPMSLGSTRRRRSMRTEVEIVHHLLRIRRERASSGIHELGDLGPSALAEPEIRSLQFAKVSQSAQGRDEQTRG